MGSCNRQKYKTVTELNLFVSDINLPLPYYCPKFNVHHQGKMPAGKEITMAVLTRKSGIRSYLTELILSCCKLFLSSYITISKLLSQSCL